MKNVAILLIIFFISRSLHATVIIGHRGASGYMPENTISSFERAIADGVDMIELDVWKCLSGELVVFHDPKLDRVTNDVGRIDSKKLDDLKLLLVLGQETIPTLREVLDCIDRRVKICIELKGLCVALDVVHVIEEYIQNKEWRYEDFIVTSFDHTQLHEVKNCNSAIVIAALIYGIPINLSASAAQIDADITVLDAEFITQRFVDDIHDRGMLVYVFTINDKDDLMNVIGYGVDGIITDYPNYISSFFSS